MSETHLRTLVRTLGYRCIAALITALWVGIDKAVIIHVVLAGVQYVYERLWLRINWGKE